MLNEEDDTPSLPFREGEAKKSRFVWVGSLLSFSDSGNRSFLSGSSSSSSASRGPRGVTDGESNDLEAFPNANADLGDLDGSMLIAGGIDDVPPKMFWAPAFAAVPPNPPNPLDPNPAKPPPAPTLTGCMFELGLGAEGAPKAPPAPNEVAAPNVGVAVGGKGPSGLATENAAGFEVFPNVLKAGGVPEVCPNAPEEGKMSTDFLGWAATENGLGVVVGVVDEGLNAPKPEEAKLGGGTLGCGVEGGVDPGLSRPGAFDAAGRDTAFPDPDAPAVGGV